MQIHQNASQEIEQTLGQLITQNIFLKHERGHLQTQLDAMKNEMAAIKEKLGSAEEKEELKP